MKVSLATRMFIRLVVLHQHARITENQWCAISVLKSHKKECLVSWGVEWPTIKVFIRFVMEATGINLLEDDLHDLYWRVSYSVA